MTIRIKQLAAGGTAGEGGNMPGDVALMRQVLSLFSDVFNEPAHYMSNQPTDEYLQRLLSGGGFYVLAAFDGDLMIGALTAYELQKYEMARREFYIYDLAVTATHRRRGVATALIMRLKQIAAIRGAYVMLIQADTAEEDKPAIALYTKLGKRSEILHFEIKV